MRIKAYLWRVLSGRSLFSRLFFLIFDFFVKKDGESPRITGVSLSSINEKSFLLKEKKLHRWTAGLGSTKKSKGKIVHIIGDK